MFPSFVHLSKKFVQISSNISQPQFDEQEWQAQQEVKHGHFN
jgi:hypothetical protein